jgi:hypothetical protein
MPRSSLGTVIDNLLESCHREVMAIRCIVAPGTLRYLVVAVPQKAEYEVGFYKWLEHVSRIGKQLDCHVEFHAHPDTLPFIRGYMGQKHGNLRSEFYEMPRWSQFVSLASRLDKDHMLVVVAARPDFISYRSEFDKLPLLIHRYFSHTSVMLLYPDQWGEPMDTVSVFAPNGRAITRQGYWFRKIFSRS